MEKSAYITTGIYFLFFLLLISLASLTKSYLFIFYHYILVPSTGSHLLLTSHSLLLLHRHRPLAPPPAQQHTMCKKEWCHQPRLRHKDRHDYLFPTTAPHLHIREHRLHSTVRAHHLLSFCPAHLSITQMPPTAQTTGIDTWLDVFDPALRHFLGHGDHFITSFLSLPPTWSDRACWKCSNPLFQLSLSLVLSC